MGLPDDSPDGIVWLDRESLKNNLGIGVAKAVSVLPH